MDRPQARNLSKQQLTDMSQKLLQNALAPSTTKNYNRAVQRYERFCLQHDLSPFPLEEQTIILFVTYLSTFSSYSNVKSFLAALRYKSIMDTSTSPIPTFQKLYYVVRGIKRTQGNTRKRTPRAPVTTNILKDVHEYLMHSDFVYPDKVMMWSAILVAFFGFLRVSEYTSSHKTKFDYQTTLMLSDLHLNEREARLDIKASKTDPFRQGVTISIASNDSTLCLIGALSNYIRVRPLTPGPL